MVAEAGFDPAKKFKRVGLPDMFPDQYGSQASLMEHFNLTSEHLTEIITGLLEPGSSSKAQAVQC